MIVVSPDFDPVLSVLVLYKRRMRNIVMVRKDTIKEQEMSQERKRIYRDTHAWILVEFLTAERVQILSKWKRIPAVDLHKVDEVLDWVEGFSEPTDSIDTETWATELRQRLAKVVMPDDLREGELERHRKAVLDREESATPDDAEWLKEELEKRTAAAQGVADLMEPTSL